jgi:hypothetical protein
VLTILIAILIVGGAFLVAEYRNKQAELVYNNISVSTSTIQNYIEGSDDWKEILLASDKSGTSTVKDITKEQKESLTQTDIVARDFFSKFMVLRQTGTDQDKLSQADLVNQTVGKIMLVQSKVYTVKDGIVVKEDSSADSIRQYGNEIGYIFKKNITNSRNEAEIAKDSLQKEDPEILKEIDPIILSYKNILDELIKISTPSSILNSHLNLINSMSSAIFIAESLRKSNIDPISGIQAVSLYPTTAQRLSNVLIAIRDSIKSLAITYNYQEGGYIFIK